MAISSIPSDIFRKAEETDIERIWQIIGQAKAQRQIQWGLMEINRRNQPVCATLQVCMGRLWRKGQSAYPQRLAPQCLQIRQPSW